MTKNPVLSNLKNGVPVFYESTFDLSEKNAQKLCNDGYDIIRANTEHLPLDFSKLERFCKYVRKYSSVERRTIVMAETPFRGVSAEIVESNSWVTDHLLNCGVESLILCQATSKDAIESFVKSCTLGFFDFPDGDHGYRGFGSQVVSSDNLNMKIEEYFDYGNPSGVSENGQLWLGIKLENKDCALIADDLHSVPGITFSEWGPGDMGMSFGYKDAHDPPYPDSMLRVQEIIMASAFNKGLEFLNQVYPDDYKELIDNGVKIFKPDTPETMNMVREYCEKRK